MFCTRSQARLHACREHYEARLDSSLTDRIKKELSGDLERLCVRLLSQERHNPSCDPAAIASELYQHGEGQWGTNEAGFIEIFSCNSQPQMQAVAEEYERQYGKSLEAAVKSEFSGCMKTALCCLLADPLDVICRLLKKATIDKMGTDEGVVNRCIGGHDKRGVRDIARRFFGYAFSPGWCTGISTVSESFCL